MVVALISILFIMFLMILIFLDVVEKLRNAEKIAKSQKLKIWENYQEIVKQNQNKEFIGFVIEIFNGDFIMVKTAGGLKKVYFSSIKPPREIK